jgi:hypothetical protein
MNKYYRPEDEEFCIGFEVETKTYVYPDKWQKQIIDEGRDIDAIFGYAEDYRVKYLDEQDIIDLGWEHFDSDYDLAWKEKHGEDVKHYFIEVRGLGMFFLFFNVQQSKITIDFGEDEDSHHRYIDSLYIKNKSELKKIMQMIGII